MHECSQALTGSWTIYDETNWPVTTTPASYAYTSADTDAWNRLLASPNYSKTGQPDYFVSCLYQTGGTAYYTPCPITVGSYDAARYSCQGTAPCSGTKHGGQCKPFMNLVAYRSGPGIYQGPAPYYLFKAFPTDPCIKYTTLTCNLPVGQQVLRPTNDQDMPVATFSLLTEGDFLRMPDGHATIVVRKVSSTQVVVLDSNWSSVNQEQVSSHVMGFNNNHDVTDLGSYRILKCVYTGYC
jgi:hypothetical protein